MFSLSCPTRAALALALLLGAPMAAVAQPVVALQAADRVIRPVLVRVYLLGTDEGDARQRFHRLDAAAFGPDGRLYILDTEGVGVVAVDPQGRITGTLGREGEGPGEFRGPRGLAVLPNGRVLIWDEAKRAFVVFGPDGAILPEVRPGVAAGVPDGPFVLTAEGALLAPAARITTRAGFRFLTGEGFSPTASGIPLLRIPVRSTAEVELAAQVKMPTREPGQTLVGLEPTPSWGPLAGGRIAVAHDDEYRIEILAPGGSPERVLTRPIRARPPSGADQRAFMRSLEGRTARRLDGGRGRPLSELPISMYRVVTPILRITTDGGRHIWVQRRHQVDPTQPGPVDLLTVSGEYLGTIVDGPGFPIAFGPGGLVAFFGLSDVDQPIVTVYRLPTGLR